MKEKMQALWKENKPLSILVGVIVFIFICFWALVISDTNEWYNMDEWLKHLQQYH